MPETSTDPQPDFDLFLQEEGLDHAQLKAAEVGVVVSEWFNPKIYVAESAIAGAGVFAAENFEKGQAIGPAQIAGRWTSLGRYANHSPTANCRMRRDGPDLVMVALEDLPSRTELTLNYRQVKQTINSLLP